MLSKRISERLVIKTLLRLYSITVVWDTLKIAESGMNA